MVHNDEKLQLEGAAAFIGVTKFTLRRWTRLRKVPFFRCGRRLVFAKSDLTRFLQKCRVPSHEGDFE